MAHYPYRHYGHGGFRHRGFWRRRRPWMFRHHYGMPWGAGGFDDGDDADAPPPPPPPSPPPFSFPFPPIPPLPSLETSEAEAEWHHRRRRFRPDDQEMGLNEEPVDDAPSPGRRGRWVLRNGKLILYGV
ncbi:MAG: hypothetical protein JOZ69_11115 [Myxococcales bacterium]|nr:hypothetical protein [Alphaproteobacteria bacterium]MBV9947390.1 hypothetical protein [Myxococcales bacterium]